MGLLIKLLNPTRTLLLGGQERAPLGLRQPLVEVLVAYVISVAPRVLNFLQTRSIRWIRI